LLRVLTGRLGSAAAPLAVAIAMVALSGCGSVSSFVKPHSTLLAGSQPPIASTPPSDSGPLSGASSEPVPTVVESPAIAPRAGENGDGAAEVKVAQAETPQDKGEPGGPPADDEDYDPWEKFNEKMFEFNRQADRFVLKPVAKVYSVILPEPFEVMIGNGFDNMAFVPRLVNSLLQGKFGGAGRELSRFLINSTLGIGGLFDAAKYYGIEKSREDFGQTLGFWGVTPGPFLVVPFLEPMTVRDGIGRGVDSLMNPLSYVGPIPFFWTGVALKLGEIVNDRALNLDLFQGFEESVVDLYSAVRHGYLRRREQLIKE
jgi:phospholipid-binding lipoprotein MlaA